MLSTKQIKGLVLEEIILVLLGKAGYRILTKQDDPLIFRDGKAGLEVQGRGEWHQIDALVGYDHTPAFLFPIRLGVEAKAYFSTDKSKRNKVGIETIRNAVGVVKDINENYSSFFYKSFNKPSQQLKLKRYNYVYAIFSLSGFTENAQRYAVAHQIYLIQYYHNHLFNGIKDILIRLQGQSALEKQQSEIRQALRDFFRSPKNDNYSYKLRNIFGDEIELIQEILKEINHIGGSYFGLLNGEYPIHILSKNPITDIADQYEYKADILVNENGEMTIDLRDSELCFDLPEVVRQILKDVTEFERRNKYFINLSGIIGGMRRDIKIEFEYPFPSRG